MLARCSRLAIAVCLFAAAISFAQDKTQKQALDPDRSTERNDDQDQRRAWFRDGRTAPQAGVPAAELLNRAQQQRQQLRSQRLHVLASTRSGGASAAAATVNATWQLLGPSPMVSSDDPSNVQDYGNVSGRITAVAIDQSDATGNTVYVGGAYGGVWKSTNAAATTPTSVTWAPLTDSQATLSVGAMALSADGTTLLVGTGEPDNAGDSYYGLGILRGVNMKTSPSFSLIPGTIEGVNFRGVGFAHFAWNTKTTTNVVASVANTSKNLGSVVLPGPNTPNTNVGLFFSNDSGLTWHQATVTDNGAAVTSNSITGLVYNASANGGAGAYFASVRTHGVFTSTDNGAHWTRLASQPTPITTVACPPSGGVLGKCPLYRGELAVTPGRDEMFFWFVDVSDTNQSVWVSRDSGVTWTDLGTGGQMSPPGCTDAIGGSTAGCSTDQGTYNLELAAVPNGTGTDLYAGAINIFKCSLPANGTSCSAVGGPTWLNTTHTYGCFPTNVLGSLAHVHPDQHAIDFLRSKPDIMIFGNDGGVYRSLNASTGITTGDCNGHNSYDNLNTNLALTQFVWFSHDATADQILLGGTQDNGSPSLNPAQQAALKSQGVTNAQQWSSYLGGDGGFNAIDPSNTSNWYFSLPDTEIFSTTVGVNSRGVVTNSNPVITPTTLNGDQGAFYTPFLLDPAAPSKMFVGTCRVWRGGANGLGFAPISNNFSTASGLTCDSSQHTTIRALAAGGLTTTNGSQVIYAGTSSGANTPAQVASAGKVFVTTNADGGAATWQDVTGAINPFGFQISSITVDKNDLSGRTAFVTIMGFTGGVSGHVFRTTNAGAKWTDVTGDLPDSPADAFAMDPGDPSVWYVATDTGVFVSTNGGVNWTEYGPASGAGQLPNVALTHLETINIATAKKLRVSTYGRGLWETDLHSATVAAVDFSVGVSGAASQTVAKGASATYTITAASSSGFTAPVTFACAAGLPAGATCTFSPASVAPGGSTTLTIKTTATAAPVQTASLGNLWLWSLATLLPGIVVLSTTRRKRAIFTLGAVLVGMLFVMPGCGGGGGGSSTPTITPAPTPPQPPAPTPSSSSIVVVTASSGFVIHSTQVTLTVQ